MQERKKRRIVIASVLKPVDDTRMFEKMAQSLATHYEIHIIGYPSSGNPSHAEIRFHPLASFQRLSFARILAPWKILLKIFHLQPAVLIITTHELLFIAALVKMLVPSKIIYDVRENYFRNILHTKAFPQAIRPFIASYVRLFEWLFAPFINHFFLAEKGYEHELSFPGKRKTILENKFKKPQDYKVIRKSKADGNFYFLFSGTLAEVTGIFVALELVEKLYKIDQTIRLTICGYCAQPEVLHRIQTAIRDKSYINFIGGSKLVPHTEVIKEIQRADVGIISYIINPSTTNSIPTKLYEYIGCQLPILLVDHEAWSSLCRNAEAAVTFNPEKFDAHEVLKTLRTKSFYTHKASNVFWESEEAKMVSVINSFF